MRPLLATSPLLFDPASSSEVATWLHTSFTLHSHTGLLAGSQTHQACLPQNLLFPLLGARRLACALAGARPLLLLRDFLPTSKCPSMVPSPFTHDFVFSQGVTSSKCAHVLAHPHPLEGELGAWAPACAPDTASSGDTQWDGAGRSCALGLRGWKGLPHLDTALEQGCGPGALPPQEHAVPTAVRSRKHPPHILRQRLRERTNPGSQVAGLDRDLGLPKAQAPSRILWGLLLANRSQIPQSTSMTGRPPRPKSPAPGPLQGRAEPAWLLQLPGGGDVPGRDPLLGPVPKMLSPRHTWLSCASCR